MATPEFDLRRQLKAWRDHRGISQAVLADRAQVKQGTIGNYEGIKSPRDLSLGTLRKLAAAMDLSLYDFMFHTPAVGVAEPPRTYTVTLPAASPLQLRISQFVAKLNEALARGLDEKFLLILDHILEREIQNLPPK